MPRPRRAEKEAQPHDALVKWTFSQRRHATGLLRAALPQAVVQAIDWRTLEIEKDTFIDRTLRKRYSDVVLSARLKGERIYFYILIEHQRKVEPLMMLRMLAYMVRMWERLVRNAPETRDIPPIMPLLLHHSETGWTAATAFQDIIAGDGPAREAMERHIPRFEVRLIDLSEGQSSHLVREALTALGELVLWCLSVAGDDERMVREIGRLGKVLDEVLRAPDGRAALEVLLRYLVATHARMRETRIDKIMMNAVGPQAKEVIVTFLDEIRHEGKREGKREGRAAALLELLAARFGALPADVRARVDGADDATLSEWTIRVLTASSLGSVLQRATPGERSRTNAAPAPARRAAPRKRSPRA